jgi:transposase
VCRDGCVETGRDGLRPGGRAWSPHNRGDGAPSGSTTNAILALREHLINEQVTLVVMEATRDYWKPFYYLLEDPDFELMLINPPQATNLPGRMSDVFDAAWLAQLGAHGLVHGSFVPPAPIRQLRDLTRPARDDAPGSVPAPWG